MQKVFAGPDWKSGRLAVVLTADEDDHTQGNKVLTVVIHPSQGHHVVGTRLTHYSLTRLYDEVGAPAVPRERRHRTVDGRGVRPPDRLTPPTRRLWRREAGRPGVCAARTTADPARSSRIS